MAAVVFLWCQALEVVVVFWERPVAAVLGVRAGQPWTAAFAVSFRAVGRWAAIPPRASQGRAQTTTAPTVRRLPVPARRACVASTSLRGSENSSHARSISSVLHAASNPFCPGVFSDLRDTEVTRTAQRSPNTPRVLRTESRAIFSCVKRLHTANKQGALCERCDRAT